VAKDKKFKEMEQKGYIGIKEATTYIGVAHSIYTRQLLLEGKFDEPIAPVKVQHKGFKKWWISKKSLQAHLDRPSRRRAGLRRYLLRVDSKEEPRVRAALDALKVEYTLEYTYKAKAEAEGKTIVLTLPAPVALEDL